VRLMIAMAFGAVMLIPAGGPLRADTAPELTSQPGASVDLSSAKKKKARKKAAQKEEYLRAVPSGPPPGAKQ
jgi:hypothetical protein